MSKSLFRHIPKIFRAPHVDITVVTTGLSPAPCCHPASRDPLLYPFTFSTSFAIRRCSNDIVILFLVCIYWCYQILLFTGGSSRQHFMPSSKESCSNTCVRAPESSTANQTKAMVIFLLGSESAFQKIFLNHIKSGFINPLALIRGWYCNDSKTRSGWSRCLSSTKSQASCILCQSAQASRNAHKKLPGSQTTVLTHSRVAPVPTINACTSDMIAFISMF